MDNVFEEVQTTLSEVGLETSLRNNRELISNVLVKKISLRLSFESLVTPPGP